MKIKVKCEMFKPNLGIQALRCFLVHQVKGSHTEVARRIVSLDPHAAGQVLQRNERSGLQSGLMAVISCSSTA